MKKYLRLILLLNNPVFANSVNTTSNSSGSVVNQAVQVVPSRNFNYQMNTIQCQGATLNISPFVSTTYGFATPYETHFDRPIYSRKDIEGDFDDEQQPIGDGDVDAGHRGEILYFEKVRTGMKQSNVSINGGITATFSIPLDREPIRQCRKAMKKQNELYDASLAAKRLNFEMSRAKTCVDNSPVSPTFPVNALMVIGELEDLISSGRSFHSNPTKPAFCMPKAS